MEFLRFKQAIDASFQKMAKSQNKLFVTDTSKDDLWVTYLNSFPEEERQSHNCNCCRQFIKNYGNVVAIVDNKIVTFWDIPATFQQNPILEYPYDVVAENLAKLVKSSKVCDIFVQSFCGLGTDYNVVETVGGVVRWNHLYTILPSNLQYRGSKSADSEKSIYRSTVQVFKRSLNELTPLSVDTALELIEQNSLYRGYESKGMLTSFKMYQSLYNKLTTEEERDCFVWSNVGEAQNVARMRNTAMGTFLEDLSIGIELDVAVTKFERVMAPENYKRPTAIFTKSMVEQAQKKIEELGLMESLPRRHAKIEDITVNNVLFANRDAKKAMNVFDALKENVPVSPSKYSKVEEIGIEDFIQNILPKANSLELLVEGRHNKNLMTLTAPVNPDAKRLFKWNNNFAWTYEGNVADSIKEKVEFYGGKTFGILRCSLAWLGLTDLDLHIKEPGGRHVYYSSKHGSGGKLDLDMNGLDKSSETPVENVIYSDKGSMKEGVYEMYVNVYSIKGTPPKGFEAEIECNGELFQFEYDYCGNIRSGMNTVVARFEYTHANGVRIISSLNGSNTTASKELWGIKTNVFQKVSLMMLSPNHWDDQEIGNKHYFFILEGCKNPNKVRGFFNEYLKQDLNEHRKVFEALGNMMQTDYDDSQLSGLGFSSTSRNYVICKVSGSFERVIKIKF